VADRTLLYYITDRAAFSGSEPERRRVLLGKIGEAALAGVDYIQLREKDLPSRELEFLARDAVSMIRGVARSRTRFLINSRTDVALAVGADGVHLRSEDVACSDVRAAWNLSSASAADPVIGVSCHSVSKVERAAADLAVFGPVFGKKDSVGGGVTGLDGLRAACLTNTPVFALGGVTLENFHSCIEVGAAGIAGIRLFQENDIAAVVRAIRG
jgi:thiamine-phosphate pyrophosphorylase